MRRRGEQPPSSRALPTQGVGLRGGANRSYSRGTEFRASETGVGRESAPPRPSPRGRSRSDRRNAPVRAVGASGAPRRSGARSAPRGEPGRARALAHHPRREARSRPRGSARARPRGRSRGADRSRRGSGPTGGVGWRHAVPGTVPAVAPPPLPADASLATRAAADRSRSAPRRRQRSSAFASRGRRARARTRFARSRSNTPAPHAPIGVPGCRTRRSAAPRSVITSRQTSCAASSPSSRGRERARAFDSASRRNRRASRGATSSSPVAIEARHSATVHRSRSRLIQALPPVLVPPTSLPRCRKGVGRDAPGQRFRSTGRKSLRAIRRGSRLDPEQARRASCPEGGGPRARPWLGLGPPHAEPRLPTPVVVSGPPAAFASVRGEAPSLRSEPELRRERHHEWPICRRCEVGWTASLPMAPRRGPSQGAAAVGRRVCPSMVMRCDARSPRGSRVRVSHGDPSLSLRPPAPPPAPPSSSTRIAARRFRGGLDPGG